MCELFCASTKQNTRFDMQLEEFFSHSKTNPDGWGLFWQAEDGAHLEKEPIRASKSKVLPQILAKLPETSVLFAHIREATSGVSLASCHPFSATDKMGTSWTLMHNGYLLREDKTAPYRKEQAGDTDSERVFLYLIDTLNQNLYQNSSNPDVFEKLTFLQNTVEELCADGANKMNLILSDGEYVYVHTNTKEATLHWKKKRGKILIATNKLDNESWGELPRNTFFAFKDGELIAKTLPHKSSFKGGQPISFEAACKQALLHGAAA